MFDVETLGNSNLAPIVQIAACEFDLEGNTSNYLNFAIDPESIPKDFQVDLKTCFWWLNQESAAQKLVFGPDVPRHKLSVAIEAVNDFFGNNKVTRVWSHATFDAVIFMNHLRVLNLRPRIGYKQFMDIRTLNFLAGDVNLVQPREFYGVAHDAIADCKFQSNYVATMLRELKRE